MNEQEKQEMAQLSNTVKNLANVIGMVVLSDRFMFDKTLQIGDGKNIQLGRTNGTKFGLSTSELLAFYGTTPVNQPAALTALNTLITHTAPSPADFAIQALTQSNPFGFVTDDEGHTVLQVILNLQTKMAEVEARLEELGLVAAN